MEIVVKPTLFVDLDGVLVDFERGFEILHGVHPHLMPEPDMWAKIVKHDGHWVSLPAMPGALKLWAKIAPYNPIILTGCPKTGFREAELGKREWCARELGDHVAVIATYSKKKPQHMLLPGDILIDDRTKNCKRWEEAGGKAIFYENAEQVILELTTLGF
jgi:hypothetical protein